MEEFEATNIYVANLPLTVTEDVLRAAFVPFGALVSVSIPGRNQAPDSRYAFVLFEDASDAAAAVDNMNQTVIHNARVRVRPAHKRSIVVPGRAVWFENEDGHGDAGERVEAER